KWFPFHSTSTAFCLSLVGKCLTPFSAHLPLTRTEGTLSRNAREFSGLGGSNRNILYRGHPPATAWVSRVDAARVFVSLLEAVSRHRREDPPRSLRSAHHPRFDARRPDHRRGQPDLRRHRQDARGGKIRARTPGPGPHGRDPLARISFAPRAVAATSHEQDA